MKIEKGVMIFKGGMGWGEIHKDGHSSEHGWVEPEKAIIYHPGYCHNPSDVTYKGSPYISELSTATLMSITRTTTVVLIPIG